MTPPTIIIKASNALSGITLYFEAAEVEKDWKGRDEKRK